MLFSITSYFARQTAPKRADRLLLAHHPVSPAVTAAKLLRWCRSHSGERPTAPEGIFHHAHSRSTFLILNVGPKGQLAPAPARDSGTCADPSFASRVLSAEGTKLRAACSNVPSVSQVCFGFASGPGGTTCCSGSLDWNRSKMSCSPCAGRLGRLHWLEWPADDPDGVQLSDTSLVACRLMTRHGGGVPEVLGTHMLQTVEKNQALPPTRRADYSITRARPTARGRRRRHRSFL